MKSFEEHIMINLSPMGTISLKIFHEDDPKDEYEDYEIEEQPVF